MKLVKPWLQLTHNKSSYLLDLLLGRLDLGGEELEHVHHGGLLGGRHRLLPLLHQDDDLLLLLDVLLQKGLQNEISFIVRNVKLNLKV